MSPRHNIICMANDAWVDPWLLGLHKLWRRRHQLMSRLAKTHRVLFVEPFFPLLHCVAKTRRWAMFRSVVRPYLLQERENLYVLSVGYLFPFNRFRLAKAANRVYLRWILQRVVRELGFSDPILWLFNSADSDAFIGYLGEKLVCYDVHDKVSESLVAIGGRAVKEAELRHVRLCQKADIVFAVSEKLRDDCARHNDNVYLMPHGVDNGLFGRALSDATEIPADIRHISHPIIGYVGGIMNKLDFDLLAHVTQARPEWSFVLIGPVNLIGQRAKEGYTKLQSQRNVLPLGARTLAQLPGYLKAIDVAVIPCHSQGYDEYYGFPLKLLEYLASGKPTVVTGFKLPSEFARVVKVAEGRDEFLQSICELLEGDHSDRIKRGIEIAQQSSWDHRVEQILAIVETHLSEHE